jgi:hypothetical protein
MDAKQKKIKDFIWKRKLNDKLEEVEKHLHVYQHQLQDIDQENLQIKAIIFHDQ